ncbi:MAG: PQQ-binding-like beta-propeller repeat protein [Rhodobacteraceae bacterium]|nr:PQQ-binding-like beta-propeller repeat protein [Paracoccaceae bacterium]
MAKAGTWRKLGFLVLAMGALASCKGNNNTILPGERVSIRPQLQAENVAAAIALGAPVSNANWLQEGFGANHVVPHLALSASPSLRWSADIGRGNSDRSRITASPVLANGVVYTLDAGGQVQASTTDSGAMLWQADITPIGDDNGAEGFGGGLALDGSSLYVTTGFGELLSLEASSGAVNWRYEFDAPLRGGPTVSAGRVFVMAANDVAYAIDGARGQLSWTLRGARGTGPVTMGGSSPAVSGTNVVLPFSSGQSIGATTGGTGRWNGEVNSVRLSDVRAMIGGLPGAPVIAGGQVYMANAGGEIAALRVTNGSELWSVPAGATDAPAVIGGAVFIVSDTSQLLRIDAASGRVLWATQLPEFTKPSKRKGFIAHYGPLIAGGQVIVAGTDGRLRFFDPVSGAETYSAALPSGAASAPIVAAGVLYVLNQKGKLLAFQ